ncbi:hypothetical protein D3C80_1644530 [compost metagenome]
MATQTCLQFVHGIEEGLKRLAVTLLVAGKSHVVNHAIDVRVQPVIEACDFVDQVVGHQIDGRPCQWQEPGRHLPGKVRGIVMDDSLMVFVPQQGHRLIAGEPREGTFI